jgi:hypothetical protein
MRVMKPALLLAAAAAVTLAAIPALTQEAPPAPAPSPPVADSGTLGGNVMRDDPYRIDAFSRPGHGQCFNGRAIVGANRAGDRTLYVQARNSPVYRLELSEPCDALYAAQKLSVRASGGAVCANDKATILVKTPAGEKRCKVREVKRLTKTEVADIAAGARR